MARDDWQNLGLIFTKETADTGGDQRTDMKEAGRG